jgi:predicted DNA-binding protein
MLKEQHGGFLLYNEIQWLWNIQGRSRMSIQITLPPELEERLRREAERSGQPTESLVVRVLEEHLPPALDERRAAAVAMLQGWMEEDARQLPEEADGNAAVLRSLDEDRPSYRKLFQEILEDTSK